MPLSDVVISPAKSADLAFLLAHDRHTHLLAEKISRGELLMVRVEGLQAGWLRFGYFWDSIPFMHLLHMLEQYRGRGTGTRLVEFWEQEMQRLGYRQVLTSTQANETAQHFYRKLGYLDIGHFHLPGDESDELILHKHLTGPGRACRSPASTG
jgi:GNAT superfamily N-acetyltransferase